MNIFLTCILWICALSGVCQINPSLKRELDSMYVLDQQYRTYLMEVSSNQSLADSLMTALKIKENLQGVLWAYQSRIDSMNLIRTEQIIKVYGYPGSSLVGKPTNEATFYIVQHSPKIDAYFPLIRQAAQTSELPFYLSAMMEDRLLTERLRPQIYGTQVACYPLRTDFAKQECFVWPIQNPVTVNQRRAKAGFTQSVEDNAKRLGVIYKPLTMAEAKRRYSLTNK